MGYRTFSDDTACDVRDEYVELLGDDFTGPEATQSILQKWSDLLKDADEAPVFWPSVAATQWKCGRLEPDVLEKALDVIDSDAHLVRWKATPKLLKSREAVLNKLRGQLSSPQPPEKPIRKRFRDTNEWAAGDLIAYRLLSRRFTVLRVIGHHRDKRGTAAICESRLERRRDTFKF